jgi:hypothetical protein
MIRSSPFIKFSLTIFLCSLTYLLLIHLSTPTVIDYFSSSTFESSRKIITTTITTTVSLIPHNTTCKSIENCNEGEIICDSRYSNHSCETAVCTDSHHCHGYPLNICEASRVAIFNSSVPGHISYEMVKICKARIAFRPTVYDYTATAICAVGSALAASSGIGGGGIFVPILLLVAKYSTQLAVPISTVMILGAAISNFVVLAFQTHPNSKHRPVIDYMTVLVVQPIILCGTTIGIMLNLILPNWSLVVLLIIILFYTTYRTTRKAVDTHRKEVQQKRSQQALTSSNNRQYGTVVVTSYGSTIASPAWDPVDDEESQISPSAHGRYRNQEGKTFRYLNH